MMWVADDLTSAYVVSSRPRVGSLRSLVKAMVFEASNSSLRSAREVRRRARGSAPRRRQ